MRVHVFHNPAEALYAYSEDERGDNLPVSLTGTAWQHLGTIVRLDKVLPAGQARAVADIIATRGFYLFKMLN